VVRWLAGLFHVKKLRSVTGTLVNGGQKLAMLGYMVKHLVMILWIAVLHSYPAAAAVQAC
jgi:hypothetical protein